MREAMNDVYIQGVSISKSAKVHGIPRSTLNDHVLGKYYQKHNLADRPLYLFLKKLISLIFFFTLVQSALVKLGGMCQ